jgi:hypothetical protein
MRTTFLKSTHVFAAAIVLSLALSLPALAVTRSWPGVAPCAGTLQACINASASADTVQIVTNTPIAERPSLTRSITLEGGDGFSAQLAPGFDLFGRSEGSAAYNIVIRKIALTNARIEVRHESSGTANIDISQIQVTSNLTDNVGIRVFPVNSGAASIRIVNNRMNFSGARSGGNAVWIRYTGTAGTVLAEFNHIETSGGLAWGIYNEIEDMSNVTLNISNNELRGRFGIAAIGISEGRFATLTSSVTARVIGNAIISRNFQGVGIAHLARNGSITTKTINNTVVGLVGGIEFDHWMAGNTGTIGGTVLNNLITRNNSGLVINTPFQAAVAESNNLLFDNVSNLYTPSASDISTDPLLRSRIDVRLRSGSSAINAANSLATLDVFGAAGLGLVDADGLRRFKAVQADIGAYEFGDFSVQAKATAPVAGVFVINDPQLNGNAGARLFTTTNAGASNVLPIVTNTNTTGVWFSATAGNNWRIFNQITTVPMPLGAQFNVFVPVDGNGTFIHTANAANTTGHVTVINNSALNNLANKIVLATANWNPVGAVGIYNPHTISVGHFPPSWFVLNNDVVNMPVGAAFNIYSQDPSPNAYLHTATAANSSGNDATALDHPLLNAIPCSQVFVTPISAGQGDTTFDVYFNAANQRWTIFNHNGVVMPSGAQFNIVIDAAQVAACNGVLFSDGFED